LLSLALLIGGIWALYRYWYLERSAAQIDLKEKESQIGLTAYLNIAIAHRLRVDGDAIDLIGDIHIENPGTKGILVDLTQMDPIRISRLILGANGQYQAQPDPLRLPILASEPIHDVAIEGKGMASLKFVARFQEEGLYSIEFWSTSEKTSGFWASYIIAEVSAAAAALPAPPPAIASAKEAK
jgi:hypothetical protein